MASDIRSIAGNAGLWDEVRRQGPVLDETAMYAMFQFVYIQIYGALFAPVASVEPKHVVAYSSRTSIAQEEICAWVS